MGIKETNTTTKIRKLWSSWLGGRLFRNHVSRYKVEGRWMKTGLCVGSSDSIGWTPIIITSNMIGKKVAIFTAIEVKEGKGRPTGEQKDFIHAAKESGAIAGVAWSEEDATKIFHDWCKEKGG